MANFVSCGSEMSVDRPSKRGSPYVAAEDAVVVVGQQLGQETALLCFDEFQASHPIPVI